MYRLPAARPKFASKVNFLNGRTHTFDPLRPFRSLAPMTALERYSVVRHMQQTFRIDKEGWQSNAAASALSVQLSAFSP